MQLPNAGWQRPFTQRGASEGQVEEFVQSIGEQPRGSARSPASHFAPAAQVKPSLHDFGWHQPSRHDSSSPHAPAVHVGWHDVHVDPSQEHGGAGWTAQVKPASHARSASHSFSTRLHMPHIEGSSGPWQ